MEEPGCYGAVDLAAGTAILFVPRLPPEYAIWEGKLHTLDDLKKRYGVDEARYTDEIALVLKEKRAHLLLTLVSRAWEQTDARWLSVARCFPALACLLLEQGKVLNLGIVLTWEQCSARRSYVLRVTRPRFRVASIPYENTRGGSDGRV